MNPRVAIALLALLPIAAGVRALVGTASGQGSVGLPQARDTVAQPAGTGSIAGRVVIAGTDQPALDAVAGLVSDGDAKRVVLTSERGEFAFTGLAPGSYMLTVSKPRYLTVSYGQKRPGLGGLAVHIRLAEGQKLQGLTLAMPLASVITGRVVDQRGEPAQGANVRALRFTWETGERTVREAGSSIVDDRGLYRISALLPGDYLVTAAPAVRQTDAGPLASVFYPGATTAALASTITLGAGDEKSGIDFQLERLVRSRVSGTIVNPDGNKIVQAAIEPVDTQSSLGLQVSGTYAGADGRFSLTLPPGQYRLLGSATRAANEPPLWGAVDLTVGNRDVEGLRLAFQPGGTLTGRVTSDSPAALLSSIFIEAIQPFVAPRMPVPRSRLDPDGRFTLRGLREGTYWLTLSQLPPGVLIQSIRTNGRDLFGLPFDVSPGEDVKDVTVRLTTQRTELSGSFIDNSGKPTADYFVLVFPADEKYWPRFAGRVMTARPATDGKYVFAGLPPGSYRLAALTDVDEGQWYDPMFLRSLLPASMEITLAAGERRIPGRTPAIKSIVVMNDVARLDETYDAAHAPDPRRWLELDEDARLGLIIEFHKRAGIHVANDRLHAAMHLVVENQLAIAEPVVVATAARLQDEGLDRHDMIHAVGSVLIDRLLAVMRAAGMTTKEELARSYLEDLAALTAEKWLNQG